MTAVSMTTDLYLCWRQLWEIGLGGREGKEPTSFENIFDRLDATFLR